ncbi:hypothetical protein HII36_43965 [Nonomuraea sp. NN258]|uniref:hypothetical protein n=1 Tax=Nonomuraea antri TaxID=2730852 RepID=UPI0015693D72|nr:hypothetical protein [Nonomuraea antri]NRQ38736.1 hypothetical protein [Nonomuraea antri]
MNDSAAPTREHDRFAGPAPRLRPGKPARPGRSLRRRLGAALTAALTPVLTFALTFVALMLVTSPRAGADSTGGGDVQVAQTLGERELTVVLRRVTGVPGPLHVDVFTHAGTPAGALGLAVVPTGVSASASAAAASGTVVDTAVITLGSRPGTYSAVLDVTQAGPWELSLDDGQRIATIPFIVPKQITSPAESAAYLGFSGAGALILATVLVAVRARRGWWTLVPGGALVACLTVAVTGALLSSGLPLPPSQGGQVDATIDGVNDPYAAAGPLTGDYSRPPATLVLESATDRAGEVAELRLKPSDAATGLPLDDVIVHDGALMHLLAVGPSGRLWHLHPVRTGPGVFEVSLPLPEAGHYAVSAEFARRGGGVQQLRSATGIDAVPGSGARPARDDAPAPAGTGSRTVAGVEVRLSAPSLVAGRAAVLTARVGDTPTLQPWLGMVGHLIVVGPLSPTAAVGAETQRAQLWAHAHAMGAMPDGAHRAGGTPETPHRGTHSSPASSAPSSSANSAKPAAMGGLTSGNGESIADESVAAFGPDVAFVYTFPAAGHYRVWLQAQRDSTILTVPYLLHVTGAEKIP